jgi:TonB family protein
VTPPRPGEAFPHADSFYPIDALRAGREGAAIVAFCVDAGGNLSDAPAIAESSGDAAMDAAAIQLATAGSGHYTAATRDGLYVRGCGRFRVRFRMRVDPRWPTLSRKLIVLNAEFRAQEEALRDELGPPPSVGTFVPGDAGQLAALQRASSLVATALKRTDELANSYVESIERLGDAADIPEGERKAWNETWPARRDTFRLSTLVFDSAARKVLSAVNELADYVEQARPPLTVEQRAEIDAIISRGRAAMEKMAAATKTLGLAATALAGRTP